MNFVWIFDYILGTDSTVLRLCLSLLRRSRIRTLVPHSLCVVDEVDGSDIQEVVSRNKIVLGINNLFASFCIDKQILAFGNVVHINLLLVIDPR